MGETHRQELVDRKRQEEVAAERKRQEEVATQRKRQEDAAERKRQEEAERKRQEEAAAEHKRQEEAAAERKRQEEAAERKRQEEEARVPKLPGHYHVSPQDVVIGEEIGKGGQATVYLGSWCQITVAIKVFGFGDKNKRVQRELDREIGALSTLRHPNIVQLFGYFQDATRTGLVLEYCNNDDLDSYCVDKSLSEKLELTKQVLLALAYLHSRSPLVIHGDVKASYFVCYSMC